ncbi:MAG: EF-hand domain-containing protein [Brevundimonas sp.]|uniref:EF-hand domain-containing protein n=1 Tax=Brevundimonas sp. TaxID=1871086 RepID=UPI00271AC4AF|nr:EF-hand domain-containing protein [Brevundimonas sp.]MDO9608545.1 EF-hand domain-containing protein [Brevundimonas sp.]
MRKIVLNGFSAMALAAVLDAGAGVATAQVPPPPADGPPPPHARGPADRDADLTRAAFIEARVARLTALDADRDGTVSVAEREAAMQAKRAERADDRFAKLDANSDGSISRAEFDAGHAARPDRADRGPGPERARSGPRGGPRHAMRGHGGPEGRGPEGRERGPVVISEVAAKLGEQFDKMDADRNGVVTADERRAAMTAHRAERQAERGAERQQRRAGRPVQQPASPAPASE